MAGDDRRVLEGISSKPVPYGMAKKTTGCKSTQVSITTLHRNERHDLIHTSIPLVQCFFYRSMASFYEAWRKYGRADVEKLCDLFIVAS